ncbi:LysR family transcriptional regulator [Reinekea marinisedimentorum]|uniref:DNA-binding transcriptional LysR family regulator n=1 Tax=Reinekea marinisedimentorum TaxID=230495 RepID=A0A4R3I560_9GAMM|nr:LysR family transcriptional regulator [Reinekea marinisedimentorum]TCS41093.1 DNA-binding transcriptional LysR family regulator [Reinekea marinisedimentorum]
MIEKRLESKEIHTNIGSMDPQQLVKMLFFIELINAGSITKAAEKMGVSTSTGSRWLQDLESELGMPLYQRNNPNQRSTEAGEYLYDKFSEISKDIYLLKNELTQFSTEVRGNIRICCSPIYAEKVLLPIVGEFLAEHPLVNVQMTVTPRGMDYLKDHDFVIFALAGKSSTRDSDLQLVRRNLLHEKFVTVASPTYLNKNGEPKTLEELSEHRCLYSKALLNENEWIFKKDGKVYPFRISKAIELSDAKMMAAAAVNSIAVAYLPEFLVSRHIECGRLVPIMTDYETDDWYLNIYYQPKRFMVQCINVFKEFFLSRHREKVNIFKNEG